jgi:hypothetical protein
MFIKFKINSSFAVLVPRENSFTIHETVFPTEIELLFFLEVLLYEKWIQDWCQYYIRCLSVF